MPQPLSKVRKLTKGRSGGPFIVLNRPELAPYILGVISAWSHTELALARILANCLHAESSAAVHMYLSLSGATQRRDVLRAVAERSLPANEALLFTLMMKAIKPVRERRNDFAHGLWSISDELPDALLWEHANNNIEDYERGLKQSGAQQDKIIVYRKSDFEIAIDEAQQAVTLAHGIGVLIHPGHSHAHDETRTLLSTLPLVLRHGGLPMV